MYDHETDPYGHLTFVIGTEDDFWCFDYARDKEKALVRIHAVINSETGSFIMNACDPIEVAESEAVKAACGLTSQALDWLVEAGDPLEHDWQGWNQDEQFFTRSLAADLNNGPPAPRIVFTEPKGTIK